MASAVDRSVILGFAEEARSYLPQILRAAGVLPTAPDFSQSLETGHRYLHTIKGAASMVGLGGLSYLAFLAEGLIEEVVAGSLEFSEPITELMIDTVDQIERYLAAVEAEQLDERKLLAPVIMSFRRFRHEPPAGDEAALDEIFGKVTAKKRAKTKVEVSAPAPEPASADLLEAFRLEADEHLQAISVSLRELEGVAGPEGLQALRRTVHTLKGAASMVGFASLGRLAHRMEDLLDHLYEHTSVPTPAQRQLLFETTDLLEDLVQQAPEAVPDKLETVLAGYDEWASGLEPAGPVVESSASTRLLDIRAGLPAPAAPLPDTAAPSKIEEVSVAEESGTRPKAQAADVIRVPLKRLDELVRLVSELVVQRSIFEQHQNVLTRLVGELTFAQKRQKGLASRLETDYEAQALNSGSPSANASDFDELELDRYGDFHLLSRALTEGTADIGSVALELQSVTGDLDGALGRLGQLTSEIQDKLMRQRMVPFSSVASRLHRALRVTARSQGKSAELVVEGQNVELDKSVLEEIVDPLLHLVRNAVDHGLEPPALRRVSGKAEQGTVRIVARHEGTEVVLEASDDGAGLQPDAIRATAIGRGLFSEVEAQRLSDNELFNLAFLPGFSTAGEISEISGRGVGLDVVKSAVNRLKGTLSIESWPGRGTRFLVRLPMTLAITRVLLVRTRGRDFAIPLAAVTRILRLERDQKIGTQRMLELDGRACPLVDLADALGLADLPDEEIKRQPILVLALGERRLALGVEHLAEAREVVVKSLGSLIRRVKGISGATLLGDGRVVPILNPSDFFPAEREKETQPVGLAGASLPRRADRPIEVLIVDDSLSVRRVLAHLARSEGWLPLLAKDGVDALEVLHQRTHLPDIVLLDIEMPRMDGYELLQTLRGQPAYQNLPVVMITSRSGPKHRLRALDLGASDYLVKPYQSDTLIAVVERLARRFGGSS